MQLHKRLTIDEVRRTLDWYEQRLMDQEAAMAKLGVKRRQFFVLLKQYRLGTLRNLTPARTNAHRKIPLAVEAIIREELIREKRLIDNQDMPVKFYNYAAVRDAVVKQTDTRLSAQTVRNRAKAWGYHIAKSKSQNQHTRVVLTTATGLLLQHDASLHLWAPLAERKWSLITTIDDYSRLLVYAELFEEETSWAHIQALQSVVTTYGAGTDYYTDNHAIFRYVERSQSRWQTPNISAKDVKTQWERTVKECGMGTINALSPEAKGKIERPYRWLQDRMVRRCAKAEVCTIEAAQEILREEVNRYNTRQVHSTTGEVPLIRFQRAQREGNTVFRKFELPEPYTSAKDVFCLKEERKVNGYSSISWRNRYWKLPKYIPEGATVRLHIIPDDSHPELRLWYKQELIESIRLAPTQFSIKAEASSTSYPSVRAVD